MVVVNGCSGVFILGDVTSFGFWDVGFLRDPLNIGGGGQVYLRVYSSRLHMLSTGWRRLLGLFHRWHILGLST